MKIHQAQDAGISVSEDTVPDSLYIIIPAYNEEKNLKQVIEDWYPIIERHNGDGKSRLVIIDDGSKDSTYQTLRKYAEEKPFLQPLTKPNKGHGATVLYGYRYALQHGADYIFQTDSDGQTDSSEFEQFWSYRKEYSAIIGYRPIRGDGKSRKLIEDVVCLLLRFIFDVHVKDANAPFRLMQADIVKKYIGNLPKNYNLPNIMFTTYFVYCGEKVKFIEITFRPRQAGKSSINLKKIAKIGWNAVGDFLKFRKNMEKISKR